jgi:hypothetical protein
MVQDVCEEFSRMAYIERFAREVLEREKARKDLITRHDHPRTEILIAIVILLVNIALFLTFPLYIVGWIVCSLIVLTFYPLTLLIPVLVHGAQRRLGDSSEQYVSTLKAFNILKKSEQFIHIEWSVFFINLRSAAVAIVCLCVSNLFVVTGLYLILRHETEIGLFIAIQFMLFFGLYLLAVLLKPYNRPFEEWITGVGERVLAQKPVIWAILLTAGILGFFLALYFLAEFLFPISSAIRLLEYEGISMLGFVLEFLAIILSQFILVRYLHSGLSRRIGLTISTSIERYVRDNILTVVEDAHTGTLDEDEIGCDRFREMMTSLIEAKMYTTTISTIFGLFPIYQFRPDLSLILDENLLKVLKGHMTIQD